MPRYMKNILTLLFVFLSINANSQSFWNVVADHENLNKSCISDNAMLGDSIIVVGGYVNLSSCEYQKIFAYNFYGQLIWEKYCESDV